LLVVGDFVGNMDGFTVGTPDESILGDTVGMLYTNGSSVGRAVFGSKFGAIVVSTIGVSEGASDGLLEGISVANVGNGVGRRVGKHDTAHRIYIILMKVNKEVSGL